jgi:hypothetical protein
MFPLAAKHESQITEEILQECEYETYFVAFLCSPFLLLRLLALLEADLADIGLALPLLGTSKTNFSSPSLSE